MPNFKYIASYPLFYPDKRDGDGQSLMAEAGVVVEWDYSPNEAVWVETDEPVTWPAQAPPVRVQKAPEPADTPPAPEPSPAPEAPAEAVADPDPGIPADGPRPFSFPGLGTLPARA